MFLVKREYFNKTYIIKGLITSCFFSAFIYLSYFGFEYKLLNTILGLITIYLLLKNERLSLFYSGFFTAIFWFYWVGISFQYYDLTYLSPLIIIFFGIVYGFLFLFIALIDNLLFRVIIIFLLSYIHPFGFNWFIPELVFINSYIPVTKEHFALVLALTYMFISLKKWKFIAIIPLFFITSNTGLYIDNPHLKIAMPQLNTKQDLKWIKNNISTQIQINFEYINKAIKDKKELIILPETAFPIVLNKDTFVYHNLQMMSEDIDIIVGSIYLQEEQYYNATYYFSKGKVKIAKKVVLVPFGEKIPLPKFFVDLINNTFYNGAKDYEKAKKPTDFEIKGIKFRNAICYEATSDEIYQNLNTVRYMIATSNNAWFTPSIEPTLQKLLLKYYAKKYDITIFHSINGSSNYIIRP
ncbi:MAG: apolipoprotein N-acyltransferase [Halarcobacter sp.]